MSCESCLRGHRASSCSHTRRNLVPVRRKGRPSSQCEVCKSKRAVGNFHGKCQCDSLSTPSARSSSIAGSVSPIEASDAQFKNYFSSDALFAMGSGRSKLSLEALMNPCKCKTTGICTCCKTDLLGTDSQAQQSSFTIESGDNCCEGRDCCEGSPDPSSCPSITQDGIKGSCFSRKATSALKTSTFGFHSFTTGSSQLQDTLEPPCDCGSNCSCPGCLQKSSEPGHEMPAQHEDCPSKCGNCSACVFGLTRPSGISAIDNWMDKDKEALKKTQGSEQKTAHCNQKARLEKEMPRPIPAPPLPPFPNANSFYSSHFLDPERRNYFANQMRDSTAMQDLGQPVLYKIKEEEPNDYWHRLKGESDEEWQNRNGFSYLTPEAIKIFDSTRQFKEERE